MCVNKDGSGQCGEGVRLQGKTVEKGEKGKRFWVVTSCQPHRVTSGRETDTQTERKGQRDRHTEQIFVSLGIFLFFISPSRQPHRTNHTFFKLFFYTSSKTCKKLNRSSGHNTLQSNRQKQKQRQ